MTPDAGSTPIFGSTKGQYDTPQCLKANAAKPQIRNYTLNQNPHAGTKSL